LQGCIGKISSSSPPLPLPEISTKLHFEGGEKLKRKKRKGVKVKKGKQDKQRNVAKKQKKGVPEET
jgi:hypothetical protein